MKKFVFGNLTHHKDLIPHSAGLQSIHKLVGINLWIFFYM